MIYIKLFEAFKSNLLSATFKFLSKEGAHSLKNDIASLARLFDFKLSNIDDSMFTQMSFSKAIEYRKDYDIIKFWFNENGDYRGESLTRPGISYKELRINRFPSDINSYTDVEFIQDDMYAMKNFVGKFARFDTIQGYNQYKNLFGYIFEHNGSIYLSNYVVSKMDLGGITMDNDMMILRCIHLPLVNVEGQSKIGFYIIEPKEEIGEIIETEKEYYDSNFVQDSGGMYDNGRFRQKEDTDFALIFDFRTLISKDSHLDQKNYRKDIKDGATKFISDREFSNRNKSRYLDQIILKYSLSTENTDEHLGTFKALVFRAMNGKNILYWLSDSSNFESLYYFENIVSAIYKNNIDDSNRYIRHIFKISNTETIRLSNNKKSLLGGDISEDYLKYFNRIEGLSNLIYTKLNDRKLESLIDLEIFMQDISYIKSILSTNRIEGSKYIDIVISAMSGSGRNILDLDIYNIDLAISAIDFIEGIINKRFK